eukprot:TRINITY_DN39371_c0_g1_i1.p1 TRINITY_DN39371_c0_g1~~TRINITY_DN39371_c0_g1_i1.p1  ORF type:complete len:198 (-),score=28.37 TRINITY_DN39371_c0_g1_i1:519-1055(-)
MAAVGRVQRPAFRLLTGSIHAVRRGYASSSDAAKVLDAVPLKAGDVILQNEADSEAGRAIIQLAKARGLTTVNVIADKPGTAIQVEKLKRLGGDIVVTESYTSTWYMKRLLSDLPAPKVGITFSTGTQATAVAQLLGPGGVLLLSQPLPKNVPYPGASKRPMPWADYLKAQKITAKSL